MPQLHPPSQCRPPHTAAGYVAQPVTATPTTHIRASDEHGIRAGPSSSCGGRRRTSAGQTAGTHRSARTASISPHSEEQLPRVVKRILALEYVEMSELRADIWPDEAGQQEGTGQSRRQPAKPPVNDIRVWLEWYARMAAILKVAHAYDGSTWVSYDHQFRREMLARKDLNWSVPDARLYNEAFTGRARSIPRCPHCLSEDHTAAVCPFNPNPPIVGWLQDPKQFVAATAPPAQPQGSSLGMTAAV